MKRFLAVITALLLVSGLIFTVGCGGGKSQKINGVADEESQVMDEAKQGSKESLPTTYMVEKGDTLWTIAKKAEIYGNDQQWPLIYDANRDILDDYKKPLEEGTKLIIPRNISAVEIEAAKEKAKEYGMSGEGKGSSKSEEAAEDAQSKVAGLGESSAGGSGSTSAGSSETSASMTGGGAEEPTPIPEPVKPRKKGGNNMMVMLLLALGVIAVIIFFIMSKQKKKEEEEEEKAEGETKTNILD